MKAVEIFMIRRTFARNNYEAYRQEAEDLANEKHFKDYRSVNIDVADNTCYIYSFISIKRPNTY